MAARHTEVAIQFKQVPFVLFRETDVSRIEPNFLVIHIAPDEGISLHFNAKMPGMEISFGVDDIHETIAAIEAHGGKVLMPPFHIETVGHLVFFQDTEGNVAGAMQYERESER